MSYDFSGKTVLVTGGMGVLGAAVSERFKAEGATVIVADRRLPKEGRAVTGIEYRTLDVLNEDGVREFFDGLERLDVVANVVGGYAAGDPVAKLDLAVLENQLDLNLKSAFLITKYALHKLSEQGGKIVHVASRAAADKGANSFAYSVSKLGLVRLVEAVAAENGGRGVNINCVMPSLIDTPANRQAMPDSDFEKWPKPAQIAGVIAFLASDEADLISGAAIPVYGKV